MYNCWSDRPQYYVNNNVFFLLREENTVVSLLMIKKTVTVHQHTSLHQPLLFFLSYPTPDLTKAISINLSSYPPVCLSMSACSQPALSFLLFLSYITHLLVNSFPTCSSCMFFFFISEMLTEMSEL